MKASFRFCQSDHVELYNCNFSTVFKDVCMCFFNWHIEKLFIVHEFCQILLFHNLKLFHVFIDQSYSYLSRYCLFWHEFLIVIVDAVQKIILNFCIQFFFFKIYISVEKRLVNVDWIFEDFDECWSKYYFIVRIHNFSKFFVSELLFHHFKFFFFDFDVLESQPFDANANQLRCFRL